MVLLVLGLTAASYTALTYWIGVDVVLSAVEEMGLLGIGGLLFLTCGNLTLRFVRWMVLLGGNRPTVGVFRLLVPYVAGFAFSMSPGKLGEISRGVWLRKYGLPLDVNFSLFVCERALDLFVALGVSGLFFFTDGVGVGAGVVLIFTVGCFAAFVGFLRLGVFDRLSIRTAGADRYYLRFIHFVSNSLFMTRYVLFSRRAIFGLLIGFGAWSFSACGLYLIIQAQGYELKYLYAFGVLAVSMIGAALAGPVGGLGGAESAMVLALTGAGVEFSAAVSITLLSRATTIGFSVFAGVMALSSQVRSRVDEKD